MDAGRLFSSVIGLVLLFSTGVGRPLLADAPTASVTGTVADASGGVLADVAVTAKDIDTDVIRSTTTNQAGVYLFLGLEAGSYEVSASHTGFTTAKRMGVELRVSDEVRIDLALVLGESKESLSVTAAAPLVQTESATVSAVVNKQAIQELPNDGRQLQNLALIVPGVSAGWNLSTAANRYGKARENTEGAFNVNGARSRSNDYCSMACQCWFSSTA